MRWFLEMVSFVVRSLGNVAGRFDFGAAAGGASSLAFEHQIVGVWFEHFILGKPVVVDDGQLRSELRLREMLSLLGVK